MTDNPSGSTGQNVTAPANAPAGSDSSEGREALVVMRRALIRESHGHACPTTDELRIAVTEAGLTRRAQHDGERVAALEKAREVLDRALWLSLDMAYDYTRPGVLRDYWNSRADKETSAVALRMIQDNHPDELEPDGDRLESWWQSRESDANKYVRVQRDAAIARAEAAEAKLVEATAWSNTLDERRAQHLREFHAERARADAAEKSLAMFKLADGDEHRARLAEARADVAESRAAALAEALRVVADGSQLALDHPKWRLSEQACDLIRAALAGNGTGEG